MSKKEKIDLKEKITKGLKQSYENLLRCKAALGQDMVFADENGQPRISPPANPSQNMKATKYTYNDESVYRKVRRRFIFI